MVFCCTYRSSAAKVIPNPQENKREKEKEKQRKDSKKTEKMDTSMI
jgi:hypothetical protein